ACDLAPTHGGTPAASPSMQPQERQLFASFYFSLVFSLSVSRVCAESAQFQHVPHCLVENSPRKNNLAVAFEFIIHTFASICKQHLFKTSRY
ncbi:hypothetical protein, partial [uncultured Bifidobacterium sp.]|uniref:hypothetical protein n=1 Tax=uncultured Bifidobacterium sp. TaxID=165187 RepID=UPI0025913F0F